ncbi:MAG: ABC transporter permease [Anaerolineaceae bacterium]|nr:ABC transporter permease [Anaerolineaceae bacterium]MCY3907027.1 ABC transporter permease [Anaerolineaceae bacterium]
MLQEEGLRQRIRRTRAVSLVSILLLLVTWYLVTTEWELVSSLKLPSPDRVLDTLVQVRATILRQALVTFYRVGISFLAGSALGVLVGLVMSRFRIVFALLEPVIEALRPIPPIALIPFFILWFGIGMFGQVLLAGLGCFMVMVVSTIEAVRNVPRIYIQAARSLGAGQDHIYRTVILPAIVPELIAGWRVALALAFGLMIAAELMGAQEGIGFMIMVARRSLNTQTILLGIIIIGMEAALADRLLYLFTRRLTRWTERDAETHV